MNAVKARRTLTGIIAIASLTGCLAYTYEEYGSKNPEKFYGTQPGYHQLSPHFAVDVSGFLMRFHAISAATNTSEKIGVVRVPWYDRSNYGPRQLAYALSRDGRRLLFFDQSGAEEDRPVNVKNGAAVADLYIFDTDRGFRELLHPDVHQRSPGCIEYPANYLPFGVVHSVSNIEEFAISTERDEVSVQHRYERWYKSGKMGRKLRSFVVLSR